MQRETSYTGKLWALSVFFIAFVVAALLPQQAVAQPPEPALDENAAGTYFIIGYPDTTANALDARYPNTRVRTEATLWIFSAVKNKVKITSSGGASQVLTLDAGKFKIHSLTGSPVIDVINAPIAKTYKVESDFPIVIYCYWANIQGLEAWTPIPVDFWGTEYIAAAVPGEVVQEIGLAGETEIPSTPKPGGANILIMAAYDNTLVTLQPPPGADFVGGPPREFILSEGQAVQVQSRVFVDPDGQDTENQEDLGGTVIRSNKPIGVISGNTRVQIVKDEVGLKNNAYKNMITEWMPPTEQYGTEFVFMPTWDAQRPGSGAQSERKREFVRIYTGNKNSGHYLQPGGSTVVPFQIERDTLREFAFGAPAAASFRTDKPAQAMMHSSAIVKFNGSTPCFRGIPCLSYDAWAPYMVEMTPREQWTTFAPYYAPTQPGGMAHYINVVTDTLSASKIYRENGSLFLFNRRIQGTDLIWGSMSVSQGEDHWLAGKDGAKFYAFAYGIFKGYEEYRPGRTKKKGDNPQIAGGGKGEAPNPLHPCEYEEYNALSYGYPLAPGRRVLKPGDTLMIDTVLDCTTLKIKARAINANPVGLRSVTLDPTSVTNARLVAIDPSKLSDIIGRTSIELHVVPIDPNKNASATVIIKDRTGKLWTIYYKYEAEYITFNPDKSVEFGKVTLNTTGTQSVIITNPLTRPVEIKDVKLVIGTAITDFAIVSTDPALPATLQAGEKMTVVVSVTPKSENKIYTDSLRVELPCNKLTLPLNAETSRPLVRIEDLNFGTLVIGVDGPKTLPLKICNVGEGELTFDKPGSTTLSELLEWIDRANFTVADVSQIEKLKTVKLKANECYEEIMVTFTPNAVGAYRTVGRVYATTREIRDTSVWVATVVKPGVVLQGFEWTEWVTAKQTDNCTKNLTPSYETVIEVKNSGTSPARVKAIELPDQDGKDGYFRLDSSARPTTIFVGDDINPNESKFQKVLFIPKDERSYSTRINLITETNDTISAFLTGTGIESHGSITDIDFDTTLYRGVYPGTPSIRKSVTIKALPTRDLHITDVRIVGADAANFWIDPNDIADLPWTLLPNTSRTVNVEFRAQQHGYREATVEFIGDHAFCDDSTGSLKVYTFTRGAETRGVNFGNVLTCNDRDSVVTLTNTGTEPIDITSITLDDKSGFFSFGETFDLSSVLGILAPGETKLIPVTFGFAKVGTFKATVNFTAISPRDSLPVVVPPAELEGRGFVLTVYSHIDKNHRGQPGSTIDVPLLLDQDLSEAKISKIFIGVLYNNKMMKITNGTSDVAHIESILKGTLLEGWTLNIVESDHPEGEYLAVMTAPPGKFLQGTGALLNMKYLLYLGSVDSSKINFNVLLVGKQCARVIPNPGMARIDSVCGLNYRLIESTSFAYTLDQNSPNPFNPSTNITFSLGLDGETKLTVYDASGKRVATLLDGFMEPGKYEVTWDAAGFPSGLYYYRLESGDWVKTNTMILRK